MFSQLRNNDVEDHFCSMFVGSWCSLTICDPTNIFPVFDSHHDFKHRDELSIKDTDFT